VTPVIFSKKLHLIQEKVRDALFPKEEGMRITVSIGGAMLYDGNIEEVIAHADQLMYYAKAYKNSVALEDDIDCQEIPPEIFEKKPYVLIIDDSVMNRDLLREMLQDKYRVLEAEDGEKGLYLLAQYGTQITLVLLDIVMPGIDGFDVLESMKKDGWLQDIPVIMISSEDSIEAVERAYTLGASDYVSRPFTMNVVRQRAANIIRLYARQQYMLHSMINQRHEKERNNKIMIAILSEVVGFVNGESRAHVLHVSKLSEMLIEQLGITFRCSLAYPFGCSSERVHTDISLRIAEVRIVIGLIVSIGRYKEHHLVSSRHNNLSITVVNLSALVDGFYAYGILHLVVVQTCVPQQFVIAD